MDRVAASEERAALEQTTEGTNANGNGGSGSGVFERILMVVVAARRGVEQVRFRGIGAEPIEGHISLMHLIPFGRVLFLIS